MTSCLTHALLVVIPVLLALLAYILLPPQMLTFKEQCLSGKYRDMGVLQGLVVEEIESVERMNTKAFLEHVHSARPVVIRGAAKDWPALQQWDDINLVKKFGNVKFFVDFRKNHNTNFMARKRMRLKEFIKSYRSKEWYLDSIDYNGVLLQDIRVPQYLNVTGIFDSDSRTNLYLSGGNTQCPIHHDGYENILTVLDGTKEILVAPPSEAKHLKLDEWAQYGGNSHPGLSPINVSNFDVKQHRELCNVKFQRITLYPGDTVYIPLFWFHYVYSPPGRNLAIGIWWEVERYIESLSDMGMWSEDGISKLMERYKKWVITRPHPCLLMNCKPLSSDNLAEVMRDKEAQYSRVQDEPLPSTLLLPSGHIIPTLGYGTGTEVGSIADPYNNVLAALRMGYRLIDTAQLYGNEEAVGAAIRDSGVERGEVSVVSKIIISELSGEMVTELIDKTVTRLGLGYVDLVLIHDTKDATQDIVSGAWSGLQSAVMTGKVRSIGLSNVQITTLEYIRGLGGQPVSVVQNLFTPLHYDSKVRQYCTDNSIVFMGYSTLGSIYDVLEYSPNPINTNTVLKSMALSYESSIQVVLLKWAAVKSVVTIARSTDPQHMLDNLEYDDVKLGKGDIKMLDGLYTGTDL